MEIWLTIIMPIIVLLLEYFVIQPISRHRGGEKPSLNFRSVLEQPIDDRKEINLQYSKRSFDEVFRMTSLIAISATSAILAPLSLRYFSKLYNETGITDALSFFTDIIANSNITFIFMIMISVVAGIGITIFVLYKSEITNFSLQVLTAFVFGFGGGIFIWPVLVLGFIILLVGLMIYAALTDKGTKE